MAVNTPNTHIKYLSNNEQSAASNKKAASHTPFIIAELSILFLLVILSLIVHLVLDPLPGDADLELFWQKLVLPHHTITQIFDFASTINWPNQALIGVIISIGVLLLLRQWAAALIATLVTAMGDASSYLTNQLVQRPRPSGHGITILQQINTYFSFPSGHVVHVIAFFGFLLFLTFQAVHWDKWLWILRVPLILLIITIAPSRVLEGEHWPSDVLGGLLLGAFWLVLGIHLYNWLRYTAHKHHHEAFFSATEPRQLENK